jgi:hypothetical protein
MAEQPSETVNNRLKNGGCSLGVAWKGWGVISPVAGVISPVSGGVSEGKERLKGGEACREHSDQRSSRNEGPRSAHRVWVGGCCEVGCVPHAPWLYHDVCHGSRECQRSYLSGSCLTMWSEVSPPREADECWDVA